MAAFDRREHESPSSDRAPFSRRQVLCGAAAAGVAAALQPWSHLAVQAAATEPAPQRIKRGGRLRVAHIGGGASETLDPNAGVSTIDAARAGNLFDRLASLAPNGTYQ